MAIALVSCSLPARAATVEFTQNSVPPGIVSSLTTHESGTGVTTVTAPATSSGYSFTYWQIDEGSGPYRVDDSFGRARNPAAFTILNPSTATAHYLPTSEDTDLDGVPDWYEIHYFSTLTNNADSDGDGDGHSLLTEYQRSYNPLFADGMIDGGLSMSRSTEAGYYLPPYFLYQQTSTPGGIHSYSAVITNGATVTLPSLADSGGYRFVWWEVNGNRLADAFGRSLATANITATNGISVIARYVPIAEDSDVDGLPDWYEFQFFGNLDYTAASDPDGDGYDNGTEFSRGYLPHLPDAMVDGGLSRSRSTETPFYGPPYCPYVINSDPAGIVSSYGFVTSGAQVATGKAPATFSGWRFTYWVINGERQADAFGVALDSVVGVVTGVTSFTANYIQGSLDSDTDGIADWYELYYFGDLVQDATSDSDGDGYSLLTEYTRNYRPVFSDAMVDGGLSRSRASESTVNLQFFERLQYALLDGVLTNFFAIWPHSPEGMDFGENSVPALGDWDGDGDLDLFVTASGSVFRAFENIGTRYAPDFAERTAEFADLSGLWSDIEHPYLSVADWNDDGKADFAVGGSTGVVRLASSSGNFIGSHTTAVNYSIDTLSSSAFPAVADFDRDGNPDLAVLLGNGSVTIYPHTGNMAVPYDAGTIISNALGTTVTTGTGIAAGDINNDNVPDIVISDIYGRIWEFHGSTNLTFALRSRVWAGSGPGFADGLTVALGDLDGDSDLDAICGIGSGYLMYLRDPRVGVPSGLIAEDGADSILLTWDPNTHYRIRGYNAHRAEDGANFMVINGQRIPIPEYRDRAVSAGIPYSYYVTAVSETYLPGNSSPRYVESDPSEVVTARVGQVELWLPDYNGRVGSNAVLQVNCRNAQGIAGSGLEIRIAYDPSIQAPASQASTNRTVELTALTTGLIFSDNGNTANGELVITGSAGMAIGEGHLFDINFVIASNAVPGTIATNSFTQATLYSTSGVPLTVSISDTALLTVIGGTTGYFLGDINGDGVLNMDDHHFLMDLLKKDSRQPTAQELFAGDINGNGTLDHRDIPLMLKLINGQRRNP